MSETTQTYLGIEGESRQTNPGFQSTLDYIRERATSEYRKGELFERLMLTYLTEDPDYKQQFSEVYLYKDWAELQTDFDANDIGIDLVAKERHGGTVPSSANATQKIHGFQNLPSTRSSPLPQANSSLHDSSSIPAANGDPTLSEPLIQSKINSESFATATLKAVRLTGPTSAYRIPNNSPINRDGFISRIIKKKPLMMSSTASKKQTAAN